MLRKLLNSGIALVLLSLLATAVSAASTPLTLVPRSEVITTQVKFDAPITRWLAQHPTLKVGVWGPDQPPIYLSVDPTTYEGLAADYIHVLERALDVKVEVHRFASPADAQAALAAGSIDLLSAYNADLYPSDNIVPSLPWLLDHSVLLLRDKEPANSPLNLTGRTLNYIADYSRASELAQAYPDASIKPELSYINAVSAVAWGQSDATWINRSTADFIIRNGFATKFRIIQSPVLSNLNLSFGVSKSNPLLLRAINESLNRIPLASRIGIANRWGLTSDNVIKANPLALTAEEQNWLRTHPEITVLFNATTAPNAFINKEGKLNGVVVDLMNTLASRYGMKFNFIAAHGRAEMIRLGQQHPDALYAVVPMTADYQTTWNVLTTRPYLMTPVVLMVNATSPTLSSLTAMRGRKIAVTQFNPITPWLQQHYPDIAIVTNPSVEMGYAMMKKGEVDGVVTTQFDANYLLASDPERGFKIGIRLGDDIARIAMAANPDNPLLVSIMNKALLDLPPESLQRINAHWQPKNNVLRQPSWRDWQGVIVKVAACIVLVVALLLLWTRHIHRISRQRESARRALADQLAFVRTLIDASPIALYVMDREKRLVHSNPALRQALNAGEDKTLAEYLLESDHLDEQVKDRLRTIIKRVMTDGVPEVYEGPLKLNNAICFVHHWIVPWRDTNNEVVGVIGGWLDISEKEKLVNDLRSAKDEADLANQSKSVFLSSMSHEIRTPMNAIIGLLELEVNEHQQQGINNENVRVAWESAKSLLLLIGDILDLSKIESGTYELRPSCIDVPQLVSSVVNLFENRAREKDLELTLEVELEHTTYLLDPLMINQLVSNLVSNAIKFTDSGSVTVSVYQSQEVNDGRSDLVIDVTDTGPGLTSEQQERIFAPFVQVEGRKARLGTGLGLSICRRLAELMGGELQVESEPGEGASFLFYFSAEACAAETIALSADDDERSMHVLIVDDHSPNRLLLTQQLEMMGHQVIAAESGEQALEILHSGVAVDLITTDVTMPGMDGFELTRHIRQLELQHNKAPKPILGLTAHAQSSVVDKCREAGMNECLFKPVRSAQLHDAVNRLMGRSAFTPVKDIISDDQKRLQALKFLHEEVIRTNRSDLHKLTKMVESGDRLQIAKMAHRLLGGARIMQRNELEEACALLENISQDESCTISDFREALIAITERVDELERQLTADGE
ncbi:transporter substrate-binding domain-containing protein [Pantoea sp. BIGb0393]|uniref:histidine kinase n=1 Tax=Pantoea nemavictus TaxID=2726955 RepID=A0ABU8PZ39_9GAMM|nr:transporter substrate-binding domain-containing protein [Pantoea nemavictus]MBA0038762.1 transporter substrate-binding domain-containing protein [Pantoea nemavictus]